MMNAESDLIQIADHGKFIAECPEHQLKSIYGIDKATAFKNWEAQISKQVALLAELYKEK